MILQPICFLAKSLAWENKELWMTLLTYFSFWTKSIIVLGGSELVNMKTPTCTNIVESTMAKCEFVTLLISPCKGFNISFIIHSKFQNQMQEIPFIKDHWLMDIAKVPWANPKFPKILFLILLNFLYKIIQYWITPMHG